MSLVFDAVKTVQGKDTTKTQEGTQKRRINACERCPFFNKKYRTCGSPVTGEKKIWGKEEVKLCGCFMDDKTTYEAESCPIGKW